MLEGENPDEAMHQYMAMAEGGGGSAEEKEYMNMMIAQQMHRQQRQQLDMSDKEAYEMQLMRSLGTDTIEEAMQIIKAAGIKEEDVPALLMSNGLGGGGAPKPPMSAEPPKLTRKQQLGIEPIPQELMAQI